MMDKDQLSSVSQGLLSLEQTLGVRAVPTANASEVDNFVVDATVNDGNAKCTRSDLEPTNYSQLYANASQVLQPSSFLDP
ncbi:hypothetical protein T265_09008 [Opisthorchis viverrini]|uniref:Uncharacterized protein n=1 Tax=Opisthorchis viverrini TaxID=6198 RepID=A0A075A6F8_OPIVI|nr:hypothetical protein T265_09008 [Opisthorchis viverrini]KER23029.1 hypothetical protein T265_09008 [Opisthorchis viverrini]